MAAVCEELTNEEIAVFARDDEEALETLIRRNEGFIVFMVSGFLEQSNCYDHYRRNCYEDYTQICRISIMKAVKNYDPGSGIKFLTYAGRIMWNDMLRQLKKDEDYRINMTGVPAGEDTAAEECDEEYGDTYDNGYEDSQTDDLNSLPSSVICASKGPMAIEQEEAEEGTAPAYLDWYFCYMQGIQERETGMLSTDPPEKQKGIERYENCKETDYSWKYPVFHEALQNLQTVTVIQELFAEHFDAAQREYLVYRYGLIDLTPKNRTEAAEHFNLSVSYARKIEKNGLALLKNKLQIEHWL